MAAALRFEHAVLTHVGCVRSVNEDAFVERAHDGLWAVADGMGGHRGGKWASATLAESVRSIDLPEGPGAGDEALVRAVDAANTRIVMAGREAGQLSGSTLAALLVRDGRFSVRWAGDSRVYLLRADRLSQLTTDHSQVQQFVDQGLLSEEDARSHPLGHVLTRAVGVHDRVVLDRRSDAVQADDVFLLCSDGLTRMVSEAEIAAMLGRRRPEDAADRLLRLALQRGAPDNVTLIVVACEPTTLTRMTPVEAVAG